MVKHKPCNAQMLLETLCYTVFGLLMLYLAISGKYLAYIAPRMQPYLYFSAGVMLLWAVSNLNSIGRPRHIQKALHCLVLAVPILFILLPHRPVDATAVDAAFVRGGAGISAAAFASGGTQRLVKGTLPSINGEQRPVVRGALPGLDSAARRIDIPAEALNEWIVELYANAQRYTGYTVTVTGFVWKDAQHLQSNQFVPARLAMSCCVADLVPIGLVCQYDSVHRLVPNTWVTVQGQLSIGEYQGRQEPYLRVTDIVPAAPIESYVYVF